MPSCDSASYQKTIALSVDGTDIDFNCRKSSNIYNWIGINGGSGFLGTDAATFVSTLAPGAGGPYVLTLAKNADVSSTLAIKAKQTAVVRFCP